MATTTPDISKIGSTLSTDTPANIGAPQGISSPAPAPANYVNPNAAMQTQGLGVGSAPAGTPITTQPSPQNTNTGDAQVLANQQAAAKLGVTIPGVSDPLADKYKAGLASANDSGKSAPTTSGAGSAGVSDLTKSTTDQQLKDQQQKDQTAKVISQLQADPGIAQLMQDQKDYLSAQSQNESLTQQYTDLSSKLGLPALNTQLINMKAVIDGSEQDIRNEITAAGGFATNSQVQALSVARNKLLVQNYNNLLQTRDNAQTQLTTMIGLAKEDQANALTQLNEKLNYDKQIADYTQKFQQNGQDALNNMQKTEGWDGIYKAALASGDPSAIQRINQTMGQGFDLATMAEHDAQDRQDKLLKAQTDQANIVADNKRADAALAETERHNKVDEYNTSQKNGPTPTPGNPSPPGYDAQGVKYTTSSAADEIKAMIKANGQTGTRNLLDPNTYNYYKSWWVQNNLKDSEFDSVFGGMKDPSLASKHVYN